MDDFFDWYDYEKVQELHKGRCEKYIDLVRKWYDAKESGDKKVMGRSSKAMSKHRTKNEELKEKASKSGFRWY